MSEELRTALTFEPDVAPQPIGRVRRKWWCLGWLSALAVARDRAALAHPEPSPLDVERLARAMLALHWTAFQYHDDDFRDLADDIAREYAVSEASPE